ncbi:MAG: hypothetical protein IT289_10775 [Oligoflexia bacterium]|nr:hypothetical protein [Oligoflexia bacterium]
MSQAFDAILACRLKGTRLYGKPLQLIDIEKEISILEYCVRYLKETSSVRHICLAISDEPENQAFVPLAEKHGWHYVFGDPKDVLGRILKATTSLNTEHVLRVTSECPFVANEQIDELFSKHLSHGADYSSFEKLPEGTSFEIIKTTALQKSHDRGNDRNRSELVTSYIFENQKEFKILRPALPDALSRNEVRVTVDYPEDLIFCRKIYRDLKGRSRLIPVTDIIKYWDEQPQTRKMVEDIGIDWGTGRIWE